MTIREAIEILSNVPESKKDEPLMLFNYSTGAEEEIRSIAPYDEEQPISHTNRLSMDYGSDL